MLTRMIRITPAAVSVAILLTGAAACTSSQGYRNVAGMRLGQFLDFRSLSRSDYQILATVEGKASFTRRRFLFVPTYSFGVVGLNDKKSKGVIKGFPSDFSPGSPLDYTMEQAIYNALGKIPNADLMVQPRFTWKCVTTQFFFGSSETCTVTVRGKAIALKQG
jgi:hypothetical protein